jgi:hypothetical protein
VEVHFTPEQEAQLSQIATHKGKAAERLVKDAALRLLENNARDTSPWEAVLELGGGYGGWFYGNSQGGTLLGILLGLLGLCTGKLLNNLLVQTKLPQACDSFHKKAVATITRWDTPSPN